MCPKDIGTDSFSPSPSARLLLSLYKMFLNDHAERSNLASVMITADILLTVYISQVTAVQLASSRPTRPRKHGDYHQL